jgi:hypothetical protein
VKGVVISSSSRPGSDRFAMGLSLASTEPHAGFVSSDLTADVICPDTKPDLDTIYRICVLATYRNPSKALLEVLQKEAGLFCSTVSEIKLLNKNYLGHGLDAVIFDGSACGLEEVPAAVTACRELGTPLICGLEPQQIILYDVSWGANDFFVSPPLLDEITKRVSHLRAGKHSLSDHQVLYVGNMVIDFDRYEVSCGGDRVILTFKEYQLLSLLALNQGKAYTREELLSDIWGYDYFGGTRTVDVHIRRLRSKLVHGTFKYIETVWNVGYRFRS